jgi:2-hydroxyglutarate dehydrogenase
MNMVVSTLSVIFAARNGGRLLFKSLPGKEILECEPATYWIFPAGNHRNFGTSHISRAAQNEDKGKYDLAVVGGGIAGLATAMKLAQKYPKLKMGLVEKENDLAQHQSGRNSGVLHAGIYYKPGSLKAILCVKGIKMLYEYLDQNKIPYKQCGKLIVAVTPDEVTRLNDLYSNALKNNVPNLKLIEASQIKDYEPNCVGLKALWSPQTGIVDFGEVTRSYANTFKKLGGEIHLNFQVNKFDLNNGDYPVQISSENGKKIYAKHVLTCGGLHSDRLAKLSGCSREPRIVPFRGEYLVLKPEKSNLVRGNIYPVPDPRFPFLGVHFTPRMDGSVWLGPNALLAFKREGYSFTDFNAKDLADSIIFKGFQKLALQYAGFGTNQMIQSFIPRLQLKALQKYIPALKFSDVLTRGGPAGVRAQAIDNAGNLVDDFVFDSGSGPFSSRVLHVRNCPSPGATSSLAIAEVIIEKMEKQFGLQSLGRS